jgi:hypothetical protein
LLLYRTATSLRVRSAASRERKSRAESRRSEVLPRLRLLRPLARRSESLGRTTLSNKVVSWALDAFVKGSGAAKASAIFRQCFNFCKNL